MARYANPAVVLGGGMTALGIIRNLGRNGVDVSCVVDKRDEAVYSKYCKEYFVFRNLNHNRDELRKFLIRLESKLNGTAVLFPSNDMSTLFLSDLKDELNGYYTTVSEKEIVETLIDKRRFYHSLMSAAAPHPTTHFPESLEDIKKINKSLVYPAFIKPSISQIFSKVFSKKGLVANSLGELIKYFALMEKRQIDVMIQEIVPGPPTNHIFIDGYFNKNLDLTAIFARRRLRMWPLAFGNSSICESIPISEISTLRDTIVEYLRSLRYRGIWSAEFKIDPRDNTGKLLEVNARSWWYNSFPAKCGIDIVFMAYLEAIGNDVDSIKEYDIGTKCIYLINDLKSSLHMITRKELGFKGWITSLLGKNTDWTFFAVDDLRPGAVNLADNLFHVCSRA